VKIIFAFIEKPEMSISEITKRTGLNHQSISKHIGSLVDIGILSEKRFGRIRILSLNRDNPIVSDFATMYMHIKD